MNFLLRLLGLKLTSEEQQILDAAKRKSARMAKYGGRIHVSKRGAIRDEFETEEGRRAYYQELRSLNGRI